MPLSTGDALASYLLSSCQDVRKRSKNHLLGSSFHDLTRLCYHPRPYHGCIYRPIQFLTLPMRASQTLIISSFRPSARWDRTVPDLRPPSTGRRGTPRHLNASIIHLPQTTV